MTTKNKIENLTFFNSINKTKEILKSMSDDSQVGAQEVLISGENIKTINGEPILGNGDIEIQTGEIGSSAYQIAVSNGYLGSESEWLLSLKGLKGDTGAQGSGVKITPWSAGAYLINSQVNFLGKDWYNTVATVEGEIPGTSSKWVERLSGYQDKIQSKAINLVKNDLFKNGFYPNIDGTFTNDGGGFSAYSFVAPFTDFYTFKNVTSFDTFSTYVFDSNGDYLRTITAINSRKVFLEKGQKYNLLFNNNSANSQIICRADSNLSLDGIIESEFDFRLSTFLEKYYINIIDLSKKSNDLYYDEDGLIGSFTGASITVPSRVAKGVYTRFGSRITGSFDAIYNSNGSLSRSVNVEHLEVIEIVNDESYIAMTFLDSDSQKGLVNNNEFLNFGEKVLKPSSVFTDLGITKNKVKNILEVVTYPATAQDKSFFGLSFDTQFRDFEVGDSIRITGKVKPSVIYSNKLFFGYETTEGGRSTEPSSLAFQLQESPASVGAYSNIDFTFTLTTDVFNRMKDGAELALLASVWGITNKSPWQVEVEDLTLTNATKQYSISKVANVNYILINEYWDKPVKLVAGEYFKSTVIEYQKNLQDNKLDLRKLKGKKILTIGDSITYGTNGNFVKQLHNITGGAITNIGSPSGEVSRMVALLTGWTEFDASGKDYGIDITQYDVVTIMAGTNGGDFTSNMSTAYTTNSVFDLPKTINSVNYTTPKDFFLAFFLSGFCNNYSVLIQFIQYYNPKCKIYLITPPVRTTNVTLASNRLVQLKSIADYYGVEMINAYQNTGMNLTNFLSKYSPDGTHFNALGNDIWGKYIGNEINKSV